MLRYSQRNALLIVSAVIGIYLLVVQGHAVGWILLLVAAILAYYQFRYNPADSALTQISQGNLEKAKELLHEIRDPQTLPPHKQSSYYLAVGWMDLKTGNLDACEENVLKSLEMGLENKNHVARANLLLAKVHASKGSSENAQTYLSEAKNIEHNGVVKAEISQFETEITIAIHYDLTVKAEGLRRQFELERQSLIQAARAQKEELEGEYEAKMAQLKAELEAKLVEARDQKEGELAAARRQRDAELAKLEQERQHQVQQQIEAIIALKLSERESVSQAFKEARRTSQVATEMFAQTLNNLDNDEMASYLKSQTDREQRFQVALEQTEEQLQSHLSHATLTDALSKLEADYASELDHLRQLARLNAEEGNIIKYPTPTYGLLYNTFRLFRAIKLRIRNSHTHISGE